MKRRDFLKLPGALGISSLSVQQSYAQARDGVIDVLIVGAGVFGIWTAWHLHRAGKRVAVIDAVGPAHSGASSGGESRVTRCGYGSQDLYTEWAHRSMFEWRALSQKSALPLFHEMGVLWIHKDGDALINATATALRKHDIPFRRWPARELRSRFPVLSINDDESGFFEAEGGGLMARRAVQQIAAELEAAGVRFLRGQVDPIHTSAGITGALPSVTTVQGDQIKAEQFVISCGPWLDRICPDAMSGRLFVTRQDVIYFSVDREQTGALPVWMDLPFYGLPSLEGRGLKVANDTHGNEVNIGELERRVSPEVESEARKFLARRFPSITKAPLSETRVCQYENSSNGDFVIDEHPGLRNVWLAGCGSGHGFKHGPAVGAHVSGLVLGNEDPIARFSLASKTIRQDRTIQ